MNWQGENCNLFTRWMRGASSPLAKTRIQIARIELNFFTSTGRSRIQCATHGRPTETARVARKFQLTFTARVCVRFTRRWFRYAARSPRNTIHPRPYSKYPIIPEARSAHGPRGIRGIGEYYYRRVMKLDSIGRAWFRWSLSRYTLPSPPRPLPLSSFLAIKPI